MYIDDQDYLQSCIKTVCDEIAFYVQYFGFQHFRQIAFCGKEET